MALAVLIAAIVITVALSRHASGQLDPRSTDPDGSRALATLLGDRGVEVRRLTQLSDATNEPSVRTVIFVPLPNLFSPDALRNLGNQQDAQVVLIAPDPSRLAAVSDNVTATDTAAVVPRPPECGEPSATAAGEVELGGVIYTVSQGTACYHAAGNPNDAGALVMTTTRGGGPLTVLGAAAPFTNDRLDEQGNAALALNLLGAGGRADEVRWLMSGVGAAQESTLADILPGWVGPAVRQLLLAALLAALWRARRLGPPVAEPLPVVVRAAEAVEGRARLYRRGRARDTAAQALRAGMLARLIPRLGLDRMNGGEPTPEAVVAAISARTGRPAVETRQALYGPPPTTDAELVQLADTLDTIVRSTLDPEVSRP
jgi:hypothetical protein